MKTFDSEKDRERRSKMFERLTRERLWPMKHTAPYYRRVARNGPEFLVRAVLLAAADQK